MLNISPGQSGQTYVSPRPLPLLVNIPRFVCSVMPAGQACGMEETDDEAVLA